MPNLQVFKETAVPATLVPNSVIFVGPAGSPDLLDIYVVNSAGTATRRTISEARIQSMIDAAVAGGSGGAVFVDTIADRNALTVSNAQEVFVVDASADATVTSGWASYVWREATSTWIKKAEGEGIDIALTWANLVDGPSSTPAQIDAAVGNSHSHSNKTQLDLIGENADQEFTYRGSKPLTPWGSVGW